MQKYIQPFARVLILGVQSLQSRNSVACPARLPDLCILEW